MINGKSVTAIIPARGGSKGLPRKNVLPLAGKPLIAWTIEAADESKYIDRCIVSTDDDEIKQVSEEFGANVVVRPAELAGDTTPSFNVLEYIIKHELQGINGYDYLVLLEPTSPLRTSQDIDNALYLLDENNGIADSIVGVSKVESQHPAFDFKINPIGLIEPLMGDRTFKAVRRQDLDDIYFLEGTIYISKIDALINNKGFYHAKTMPYVVPRWKSIEIDERLDVIIAEAIIHNFEKLNEESSL